jgi:hypothetical protein
MNVAVMLDQETSLDPVEEIRLRTWARQHYIPRELRDDTLHPIILEEMRHRDQERPR